MNNDIKQRILTCEKNRINRFRASFGQQKHITDLQHLVCIMEKEILDMDQSLLSFVQMRERANSMIFFPEDLNEDHDETQPLQEVSAHVRRIIIDNYRADQSCPVCLETIRKSDLYIPICGHFLCDFCASQVSACPICRA